MIWIFNEDKYRKLHPNADYEMIAPLVGKEFVPDEVFQNGDIALVHVGKTKYAMHRLWCDFKEGE